MAESRASQLTSLPLAAAGTLARAVRRGGRRLPLLDAFLWTGVPGRSHNSTCHPGDAPAGVFFTRFALELAANANQELGPGFPSLPY